MENRWDALNFEHQIFYRGPAGARQMLITELLPPWVREHLMAVANSKVDKITVWNSGRVSTPRLLSGLAAAVSPLHDLARNAGVEMPDYLGKLNPEKNPTPSKTD